MNEHDIIWLLLWLSVLRQKSVCHSFVGIFFIIKYSPIDFYIYSPNYWIHMTADWMNDTSLKLHARALWEAS
jgi:hypothetical protein